MKILITGIAGFIGSQIAKAAIERGYAVVGVDDLSQGHMANVPKDCEFHKLDLVDPRATDQLPTDIDVILHLAGQSSGEISFDDPVVDMEKNAVSTLNLIRYGIKNNAKKLIHASSMSVYGTTKDMPISEDHPCAPLSCYGVGKLAAENYLKIYQNQLPFVSFRMFNVYGPGQNLANLRQGMVSIYIAHMIKTGHIPVKGSLDRFRDFIHIDDVVNIWLQAIEKSLVNNAIFNLGTGIKTTVHTLLTSLQKIDPTCTWSEVDNTPGDQFGIYADNSKTLNTFDFQSFTPLTQGLGSFVQWAKSQRNA